MMRRRTVIVAAASAAAAAALAQAQPAVEVWKSPSCGCCKDWLTHLEANDFRIAKVHDIGNTGMRGRLGVPADLASCHTALVAGYAIEGHVPAADIRRLLAQRPDGVIGLAVAGMPIGSPGMDGPAYGHRRDRYDVILLHKDGRKTVFATHS